MKKILTLLVMFLMTGGILMAQAPKFSYQAVLRDSHNELVRNQAGTVTFVVAYTVNADEAETEWPAQDFKTNENGMATIWLDNNPDVDWRNAVITATFKFTLNNEEEEIVVTTPVMAVPYALQAENVNLTTDAIVNYINNGDSDGYTNGEDWAAIYGAARRNQPLQDGIRDTIVAYIKANKDLAKEIALHYMTEVTAQDIRDAYDTARNLSTNVKDAFYNAVKDYLKHHRSLMVDIAKYYLSTATSEEINTIYNDLKASDAAQTIQNILYGYFADYLRAKGLICTDDNNDVTLCDVVSTLNALTECPVEGDFTITPSITADNDFVITFTDNTYTNLNVVLDILYYVNGNDTPVQASSTTFENNSVRVHMDNYNTNTKVRYSLSVGVSGCPTVNLATDRTYPNN